MPRYIDAEELLKRYKVTCEIVCQYSKKQRDVMCSACGVGSCIEILEDFPTADIAEVMTEEDVKRWCRKRCFSLITNDLFEHLKVAYNHAIDVAEVKRGHWIVDRKFGNDVMSGEQMVICSECGKGIFWGKQNYCPNCGAKMDEVDNENPEP